MESLIEVGDHIIRVFRAHAKPDQVRWDTRQLAAGLALVNSIGNSAGFVAPSAVGWLKDATGTFTAPLLFLSGALALGSILAVYVSRAVSGRKWPPGSGVPK